MTVTLTVPREDAGAAPAETWRTKIRVALLDPSATSVLAREARPGVPVLPVVEIAGRVWPGDALDLAAPFREQLGAAGVVLWFREDVDDAEQRICRSDVLVQAIARDGADGTWMPLEVLAAAAEPEDATLLRTTRGDRPQPWMQPGWYDDAARWISTSLAAAGHPTTGPVEQYQTWSLASVLRVPTVGGYAYFKTSAPSPLFCDEASVTVSLAELFPRSVPPVLAVDRDRRWVVTRDAGPAIGWEAPVEVGAAALRAHAATQVAAIPHVSRLLAAGCVDRRLDTLAELARKVLAPAELRRWVPTDVVEAIPHGVEAALDCTAALRTGPVPETLIHGDLNWSNVGRQGEQFVVFDWTDAAVSHPFLDPLGIFDETRPDVRELLLDAYLAPWLEFAPADELRALFDLAEPVAALFHTISYVSLCRSPDPAVATDLAEGVTTWLAKLADVGRA